MSNEAKPHRDALDKLSARIDRIEHNLGIKDEPTDTTEAFERLHVQVTQSQYAKLKQLAFERRVSLAELVRQALTEWLPR